MGSDRIEVSQEHHIPWITVSCLLVSGPKVSKDLFQHALGLAIGVGALSFWALFCDWNYLWHSIDSSGGGEDYVLHSMLSHYVHKHQCAADVVVIILPRLQDAFPYSLKACKVDYSIEVSG